VPTFPAATATEAATQPAKQMKHVTVGQKATDDGIVFKITGMGIVTSIPTDTGALRAGAGTHFIRVDVTFRNDSDKPVDYGCEVFAGESGARLVTSAGRTYTPMTAGFEVSGNGGACSDGIQPGLRGHLTIPFQVPSSVDSGAVLLWNPDADDPDNGGTFISVTP
jgi:hypothetical protein